LNNYITDAHSAALYPRWDAWVAKYKVANRFGVFNGPITTGSASLCSVPAELRSPSLRGPAMFGLDGDERVVKIHGYITWRLHYSLTDTRGSGRIGSGTRRRTLRRRPGGGAAA
jgi:hypothetical protein